MTVLGGLETLIAGVWLGGYLFTTFIVSPALKSLMLGEAERVRVRSSIGRRYGKLAGPLLLAWLLALLLQGFSSWTLVRLGLLTLLIVAVGVHGYLIGGRMQRLAEREALEPEPRLKLSEERRRLQRLSARITPVALVASLLLAVTAHF